MDVRIDTEGQATTEKKKPTRGPKPVGIVITEETMPAQQGDVCVDTLRRQPETPTPWVETPNPFAVLITSEGGSRSAKGDVQFEEDASPLMIEALLQEDDLLDVDIVEGEAQRDQLDIEAREDEVLRRMGSRGGVGGNVGQEPNDHRLLEYTGS